MITGMTSLTGLTNAATLLASTQFILEPMVVPPAHEMELWDRFKRLVGGVFGSRPSSPALSGPPQLQGPQKNDEKPLKIVFDPEHRLLTIYEDVTAETFFGIAKIIHEYRYCYIQLQPQNLLCTHDGLAPYLRLWNQLAAAANLYKGLQLTFPNGIRLEHNRLQWIGTKIYLGTRSSLDAGTFLTAYLDHYLPGRKNDPHWWLVRDDHTQVHVSPQLRTMVSQWSHDVLRSANEELAEVYGRILDLNDRRDSQALAKTEFMLRSARQPLQDVLNHWMWVKLHQRSDKNQLNLAGFGEWDKVWEHLSQAITLIREGIPLPVTLVEFLHTYFEQQELESIVQGHDSNTSLLGQRVPIDMESTYRIDADRYLATDIVPGRRTPTDPAERMTKHALTALEMTSPEQVEPVTDSDLESIDDEDE